MVWCGVMKCGVVWCGGKMREFGTGNDRMTQQGTVLVRIGQTNLWGNIGLTSGITQISRQTI